MMMYHNRPGCQCSFCLLSSHVNLSLLSLCNFHLYSTIVTLPCFVQLNYQSVISVTKKTFVIFIKFCVIYNVRCNCKLANYAATAAVVVMLFDNRLVFQFLFQLVDFL